MSKRSPSVAQLAVIIARAIDLIRGCQLPDVDDTDDLPDVYVDAAVLDLHHALNPKGGSVIAAGGWSLAAMKALHILRVRVDAFRQAQGLKPASELGCRSGRGLIWKPGDPPMRRPTFSEQDIAAMGQAVEVLYAELERTRGNGEDPQPEPDQADVDLDAPVESDRPADLITTVVAVGRYGVSRATLYRRVDAGELKSYRRPDATKNAPHQFSEAELQRLWPPVGQPAAVTK